ncbi:MAG: hypothetical protein JW850_10575 [Thermoflexales bacterium]|nr:hypothetical protein [Thermoflexales bacterium]
MTLPFALDQAYCQKRLLLVWGASPYSLEEHEVVNRVVVLGRWLEQPVQAPSIPLHALPPLSILSVDPSERVEEAFGQAGVPLHVVRSRRDVVACERHTLLKLAGDLAERCGVILGQVEIFRLRDDADKRYMLDEAARLAGGGAVLLAGCNPLSEDFRSWWSVLGPFFERAACFALGDPAVDWPPGITCLETPFERLAADLRESLSQAETDERARAA